MVSAFLRASVFNFEVAGSIFAMNLCEKTQLKVLDFSGCALRFSPTEKMKGGGGIQMNMIREVIKINSKQHYQVNTHDTYCKAHLTIFTQKFAL